MTSPQTFTCPRCGATSANPNDIREGYCGRCHDWTGQGTRQHDAIDMLIITMVRLLGKEKAGLVLGVYRPVQSHVHWPAQETT